MPAKRRCWHPWQEFRFLDPTSTRTPTTHVLTPGARSRSIAPRDAGHRRAPPAPARPSPAATTTTCGPLRSPSPRTPPTARCTSRSRAPATPAAALAQCARLVSLDHYAARLVRRSSRRGSPPSARLLDEHHGLRPTLFGALYEAAAWGGDLAPDRHGAGRPVLTRRLVARPRRVAHRRRREVDAFPTARGPARASTSSRVSRQEKVRRLHGVADAALDGDLDVARLRALGPDGARAALRRLRGIGEFWASGIWLRACGVVDEFPDEPRCPRRARADPRPPPRRPARRPHRAPAPLPHLDRAAPARGRPEPPRRRST